MILFTAERAGIKSAAYDPGVRKKSEKRTCSFLVLGILSNLQIG